MFLKTLNVSLNTLEEKAHLETYPPQFNRKLLIRTLFERNIEDVLKNFSAISVVLDAAEKATSENSILEIPPSDHFFIYNTFMNTIAEKFSAPLRLFPLPRDSDALSLFIFFPAELRTKTMP